VSTARDWSAQQVHRPKRWVLLACGISQKSTASASTTPGLIDRTCVSKQCTQGLAVAVPHRLCVANINWPALTESLTNSKLLRHTVHCRREGMWDRMTQQRVRTQVQLQSGWQCKPAWQDGSSWELNKYTSYRSNSFHVPTQPGVVRPRPARPFCSLKLRQALGAKC
jgi:hypothetical protein